MSCKYELGLECPRDAELEDAKKFKDFIVNTFVQHIENKWNWSDEDVLHIIRACAIPDEEFEIRQKEQTNPELTKGE